MRRCTRIRGARAPESQRLGQRHGAASSGNNASATRALRRCSRPCPPARPGAGNVQRKRSRGALGRHDPRGKPGQARFSRSPTRERRPTPSVTGPPPPTPSNSLVNQPAPRATAFHATRCGGSPRWNSRNPVRSASSLRPCGERVGARCAVRQRRRADLDRRIDDAGEREMDIGPAAPEPQRKRRGKRHASQGLAPARRRFDLERDRQRCARRNVTVGRARLLPDSVTALRASAPPCSDSVNATWPPAKDLAGRQRRHLDPGQVAERVQQGGGQQPGEQKRDAHPQRQRVVERCDEHHRDRWPTAPSRAWSAGCRCANGAGRLARDPRARRGMRVAARGRPIRRPGSVAFGGDSARHAGTGLQLRQRNAAHERLRLHRPARVPPARRWPATAGNTAWTSSGSTIGRPAIIAHARAAASSMRPARGLSPRRPRFPAAIGAVAGTRGGDQRLHVIEQRGGNMNFRRFALPIGQRRGIGGGRRVGNPGATIAAHQQVALARRVG